MIRARRLRRPAADCHSADVLTPPERHVARRERPRHERPKVRRWTWADDPAIRSVLQRWGTA